MKFICDWTSYLQLLKIVRYPNIPKKGDMTPARE